MLLRRKMEEQVVHDLLDFHCIDNGVVRKVLFLEPGPETVELVEAGKTGGGLVASVDPVAASVGKRTGCVILRNLGEQIDMFVARKDDANTVGFNPRHAIVDSEEQILVGNKLVVQVVLLYHLFIRLSEDLVLGVFPNNFLGLRIFVSDHCTSGICLPVIVQFFDVTEVLDLVGNLLLVESDHTLLGVIDDQPFEDFKSLTF